MAVGGHGLNGVQVGLVFEEDCGVGDCSAGGAKGWSLNLRENSAGAQDSQ